MKKTLAIILSAVMILGVVAVLPSFAAEAYTDAASWIITASSDSIGVIRAAFDGDLGSYWHTSYTVEDGKIIEKAQPPHIVNIEFPEKRTVGGIRYIPRQKSGGDTSSAGIWNTAEFYVSEDGVHFVLDVTATFNVTESRDAADVKLTEGNYKALRIKVTSGAGGFATAAEIKVLKGEVTSSAELSYADSGKLDFGIYTDSAKWNISASSDSIGGIGGAFDDDLNSYWHTSYTVKDGQIAEKAQPPHIVNIEFPEKRTVSGIRYIPRQLNGNDNSSAGIWYSAEIYVSEDNKTFTLAATAFYNVEESRAAADAVIGEGLYKAIRIKVTDSSGGFATAAEIKVFFGESESRAEVAYDNLGKIDPSFYSDQKSWEITASDDGSSGIGNAFDGNEKTFWHTGYTVENGQITSIVRPPHTVTVRFPERREISSVRYVPRPLKVTDSTAGIWKTAEIYVSENGVKFKPAAIATYSDAVITKREAADVKIKKGSYKAIKIVVTDSVGGFAAASEIMFSYGSVDDGVNTTVKKPDNTARDVINTEFIEGKTDWEITASSYASFGNPRLMLDNNESTFWHTAYTSSGSTITGSDKPPYYIDITMPEAITAAGFYNLTRPSGDAGIITEYKLYASATDSGELYEFFHGVFDERNGGKTSMFTANVIIKRCRIEVIKTNGGSFGTCSEIDFIRALDDFETVRPEEYPDFDSEYGHKEISLDLATISANCDSWVDNYPKLAIDKKFGRYWQTEFNALPPYELALDLGEVYKLSRIDIVPRRTSDYHGTWMTYNILTSADGVNYTKSGENLHNAMSQNTKIVTFNEPVSARYIKFEITDGYTNKAACAELMLYQTAADERERIAQGTEEYVITEGERTLYYKVGADQGTYSFSAAPYSYNGVLLIPLDGVLEKMNASIHWEEETHTINISKGAYDMTFQIWSNLVYVDGTKNGRIRYTLAEPPRLTNGSIYVPIKFITDYLGYSYVSDGNGTVTISKEYR